MGSTSPTVSTSGQGDSEFEQQLRQMNEALLISSVQQHELAAQAQLADGALAKALAYGNDIIATLREPILVLDHDVRVQTANRSFYDTFHVSKEETENHLVYDLGNGQWDIPALRKLLDEVLSRNQSVYDYEVQHTFPNLGHKTMLLNAWPLPPESKHPRQRVHRTAAALKDEGGRMKDESGTDASDSSFIRHPSSLKVLVVDDNVDTAETLALLLEESGHQVRMAHDGPTVLETDLADRPSVVFLDVGLPGLNGFEVARRIREQLGSENVIPVAVTGYGHEKDRRRSQEAGFDHHLVKPVVFDKVQQILAMDSAKKAERQQ